MTPIRKKALIQNLTRWVLSAAIVGVVLYLMKAPVIPVLFGMVATLVILIMYTVHQTRENGSDEQ